VVLPLLIRRCRSVLAGYLSAASLRGNYPFERVREEELVYVLHELLELELWAGSFSALQTRGMPLSARHRSRHADFDRAYVPMSSIEAPKNDVNAIGQALGRSARAHLFYLYPILLELLASPLQLPKLWISPGEQRFHLDADGVETASSNGDGSNAIELAARVVIKQCLDLVGREMCLSV
jgi:hypothetical protein